MTYGAYRPIVRSQRPSLTSDSAPELCNGKEKSTQRLRFGAKILTYAHRRTDGKLASASQVGQPLFHLGPIRWRNARAANRSGVPNAIDLAYARHISVPV